MTELIICAVCNKPLYADHGNIKYHPECAILQHNKDSIIRYAIQSSFNDEWWLRIKVVKDALRMYGAGVEIDPVELLNNGLNYELPFTSFTHKEIIINSLGKIGFSINKNKTIQLWIL